MAAPATLRPSRARCTCSGAAQQHPCSHFRPRRVQGRQGIGLQSRASHSVATDADAAPAATRIVTGDAAADDRAASGRGASSSSSAAVDTVAAAAPGPGWSVRRRKGKRAARAAKAAAPSATVEDAQSAVVVLDAPFPRQEEFLLPDDAESSDQYLKGDVAADAVGTKEGEAERGAVDKFRSLKVVQQFIDEQAREDAPEPTLESLSELLPFPLDGFQAEAVAECLAGHSVMVCAPTGAGKTAIAVLAALAALGQGYRVIYTTPLKALSNQKLRELQEVFGPWRVGLRTGDVSLNMAGDVIVMTTEILRNISYSVQLQQCGAAPVVAEEGPLRIARGLDEVGLVILDEVHYLGHPGRGSVWEEIVINLPPHVQVLAMSATVANPDEIGGWIEAVHGSCKTIETSFRPVPLRWLYAWDVKNDAARSHHLQPLLDEGAPRGGGGDEGDAAPPRVELSPQLRGTDRRSLQLAQRKLRMLRKQAPVEGALPRRLARRISDAEADVERLFEGFEDMVEPLVPQLVQGLQSEALLPAIYFIFSRKRCNSFAIAIGQRLQTLVTPAERAEIAAALRLLQAAQPDTVPDDLVEPLLAGVASHHAGMLPGWKALVERLFQRGLIKVVFATETLAAGINMPARTTVISALSRRSDDGHEPLKHNDLLQMAGRAGRRGYDDLGQCVVTKTRWEGAREAGQIIARGPERIMSQFVVSYSMVLNLLSTRTLPECQAFLERSFMRYQATQGAVRATARIEATQAKIARLEARAAELSQVEDRTEARPTLQAAEATLAAEARALKVLVKQVCATLRAVVAERLCLRDAAAAAGPGLPARFAGAGSGGAPPPPAAAGDAAAAATLPALVSIDVSDAVTARSLDGEGLVAAVCVGLARDMADALHTEDYVVSKRGLQNYRVYSKAGWLACLGADNMLYIVPPMAVMAVHEAPYAPGAAAAGAIREAFCDAVVMRWNAAPRHFSIASGVQTAATAVALAAAAAQGDGGLLLEDSGWPEALAEAEERLAARRRELEAAREAQAQDAGAGATLADVHYRIARHKSLVSSLLLSAGATESAELADIEQTVEVLQAFGALRPAAGADAEEGRYEVLPLGRVARDVRFDNELWVALLLDQTSVREAKASSLAGLLCALAAPLQIHKSGDVATQQPSAELVQLVESVSDISMELARAQAKAGIHAPIVFDLRVSGAIEAWTWGTSWESVKAICELEDGDLARLFVRVADLLRQISMCEHVDATLRSTADAARRAIYRQPIKDVLA